MKKVRILIADEHTMVRRGLRSLIRARGDWSICGEAANGLDAVAKAIRLKPDLVVMGISLPDLSGIEATQRVIEGSPRTEVLILTMHDEPEIIEKSLAAGARGYVLKSDSERDLVRAIQETSSRKPFFGGRASEAIVAAIARGGLAAGTPDQPRANTLTRREREVLNLIATGSSNKQVADKLGISPRTAEIHRANLMRKLGIHNGTELVRYALREGIVSP